MTAVLTDDNIRTDNDLKIIGMFFTATTVKVHPFQEVILIYQKPREDTIRMAVVRKKGRTECYADDSDRATNLLSELNQQISRCLPDANELSGR